MTHPPGGPSTPPPPSGPRKPLDPNTDAGRAAEAAISQTLGEIAFAIWQRKQTSVNNRPGAGTAASTSAVPAHTPAA